MRHTQNKSLQHQLLLPQTRSALITEKLIGPVPVPFSRASEVVIMIAVVTAGMQEVDLSLELKTDCERALAGSAHRQ